MKENAGMQEKNTGSANDELSQVGNLSVKRTRTEKILAFIACFIAAFFIWYYAADHDTAIFEESFSSVPVEIVNGSGFSVLSGGSVLSGFSVLWSAFASSSAALLSLPEFLSGTKSLTLATSVSMPSINPV